MATNRLRQITELGQAIWLDNLSRKLLDGGELARMIDGDDVASLSVRLSIRARGQRRSMATTAHVPGPGAPIPDPRPPQPDPQPSPPGPPQPDPAPPIPDPGAP